MFWISSHTPTKGVTILSAALLGEALFQSTLPRREWHRPRSGTLIYMGFQSTLPRREWLICGSATDFPPRFQSTLPQREWRGNAMIIKTIKNDFNPHSHKGSDTENLAVIVLIYPFQSTLPQREWRKTMLTICEQKQFQSTLPQREWRALSLVLIALLWISIHTPTKGVTCTFYNLA